MSQTNKLKIFNDPIYGFITIPNSLVYDLIQHPYFQRLRRISQMGLSYLVYPGAQTAITLDFANNLKDYKNISTYASEKLYTLNQLMN